MVNWETRCVAVHSSLMIISRLDCGWGLGADLCIDRHLMPKAMLYILTSSIYSSITFLDAVASLSCKDAC